MSLLLVACTGGDDATDSTPAAGTAAASTGTSAAAEGALEVVLVDFAVRPSVDSVAAGSVTIAARNGGETGHELVVIRSDAAPDALPQAEGRVVEAEVDIVGEIEGLDPGAEGSTVLDLSAGRYLLICNVAGHYALGMVAPLTVQ